MTLYKSWKNWYLKCMGCGDDGSIDKVLAVQLSTWVWIPRPHVKARSHGRLLQSSVSLVRREAEIGEFSRSLGMKWNGEQQEKTLPQNEVKGWWLTESCPRISTHTLWHTLWHEWAYLNKLKKKEKYLVFRPMNIVYSSPFSLVTVFSYYVFSIRRIWSDVTLAFMT